MEPQKQTCISCLYHSTFYDIIDGESFGDGCVCECDEPGSEEATHIKSCFEYTDEPAPCPKWKEAHNH